MTPTQDRSLSVTPSGLRIAAVGAPVLLLLYGILRLVDGIDGVHGPGLAWNLGHILFFAAFVLLGVLLVGLRRLLAGAVPWQAALATVATVAGLVGVAGFLWVILGDLVRGLADQAPLPDPLYAVTPLLFQFGLLTLLVQLATVRPPWIRWWSPPLVLVGFVAIAGHLDLLPVGALLIMGGLADVIRRR